MKIIDSTILQITPAGNFLAVFASEDATIYTRPVACWALIRRTFELNDDDRAHVNEMDLPVSESAIPKPGEPLTFTHVEGLSSGDERELLPCENDRMFLGYAGPSDNLLEFQERARDLVDEIMEEEDDEDDDGERMKMVETGTEMADNLPQTLSHLSVEVQERIRKGKVPPRWEQGGWLEFMRRFGDLSGG